MGPFDRFNDRAKRVLALAQDEAIRFDHNYIGPEHLLLGLVREGEGLAARVVDSLGVPLSRIRMAAEMTIGRGEPTTAPSDITLSPATKNIINFAVEEMRLLGHGHVGTEHLLLGFVRQAAQDAEAPIAKIVKDLGLDLDRVRERTVAILSGQVPPPGPRAEPRRLGPFDRFDDRAKRVLALAQDEAIRFNHNYMGVEHLLLGLVREGEGVAGRVLDSLGVELTKVRTALEFIVGRGEASTQPSDITLTPRLKKVMELAIDESRKLGHSHVGTEHLLLGIVRESGSIASGILESLGVALETVRQQTIAKLGQRAASAGAPPEVVRELFDAQGRKRDWYCEDVLTGKLKVNVVYEDERVMAMEHPYPEYVLHGVVIPKRHVASLLAGEALDGELLVSMLRGVQVIAGAVGLDKTGFQLQANAAAPGVTPHMHWHVVGPGLPPQKRA
jgi:ATP-dependent Clp protease ATP-binding subunit ClpA